MTPRRPKPDAARFVFKDATDRSTGFAPGLPGAELRRLKRGQIAPRRSIDLHGLRAREARDSCLDELQEAIAQGERCVRVVHGRGRGSKDEPVLRSQLPDWLADSSLAGAVLAFCPAQPADGGSGASYVLLRRPDKLSD